MGNMKLNRHTPQKVQKILYEITTHLFSYMQGYGLSIQEDLLNKYAEDMVKYCTTATGLDSRMQYTPASKINILDKKEQEVVPSPKLTVYAQSLFTERST
jgi:hypothetical protein